MFCLALALRCVVQDFTEPFVTPSPPFLTLQVMRIRDTLSAEFSRLCYYGFWYAPEMELVMNSIDFSQRHVTGAVEIKLYKGNCIVIGRESPVALYR